MIAEGLEVESSKKVGRAERRFEVSESWSVEEDDETVKARAYLNKGSVSDTPRWPLIRPRVARLRGGVITTKGNT